MPNELKPCPFCGGKARAKILMGGKRGKTIVHFVICSVCRNRTAVYLDKDEATEAWNRRSDNGNER